MKTISETKLGEVYLENELVVSDPCYESDYGIANLPYSGLYTCFCTNIGGLVSSISIVLSNSLNNYKLGEATAECGVDSGQLGIFNKSTYRKEVSKEIYESTLNREFPYENWKREYNENSTDKFFSACCNITLSNNRAGILEGIGIVSSSGYGDGVYSEYTLVNSNNEIVGLKIVFIGE